MSISEQSDCSERSDGSNKSSVSFSTISFHEHAMILGDNPSTSSGPSLEIDWSKQSSSVLDLEEYEATRYPRRSKKQLHVPGVLRTNWLLASGHTLREINDSMSRRSKKDISKPKTAFGKFFNFKGSKR